MGVFGGYDVPLNFVLFLLSPGSGLLLTEFLRNAFFALVTFGERMYSPSRMEATVLVETQMCS